MSEPRELNLDRMRQGHEGVDDFYGNAMDAIDAASDQDTTTWVIYSGRRIAAIVPVDVAERELQTVDEVYEHVRRVTGQEQVPEFFRSAQYVTLIWRRVAQDYAAGFVSLDEKNKLRERILALAAGLERPEQEKLPGPIREALAAQFRDRLAGTPDPDRCAEPGR